VYLGGAEGSVSVCVVVVDVGADEELERPVITGLKSFTVPFRQYITIRSADSNSRVIPELPD